MCYRLSPVYDVPLCVLLIQIVGGEGYQWVSLMSVITQFTVYTALGIVLFDQNR